MKMERDWDSKYRNTLMITVVLMFIALVLIFPEEMGHKLLG